MRNFDDEWNGEARYARNGQLFGRRHIREHSEGRAVKMYEKGVDAIYTSGHELLMVNSDLNMDTILGQNVGTRTVRELVETATLVNMSGASLQPLTSHIRFANGLKPIPRGKRKSRRMNEEEMVDLLKAKPAARS